MSGFPLMILMWFLSKLAELSRTKFTKFTNKSIKSGHVTSSLLWTIHVFFGIGEIPPDQVTLSEPAEAAGEIGGNLDEMGTSFPGC